LQAVQDAMPYVKLLVVTGDLTDSLHGVFAASYQHEPDWTTYAESISHWKGDVLDVCGNHDIFNVDSYHGPDGNFFYAQYSASKSVHPAVSTYHTPVGRPIQFVRIPAVVAKKRGPFRHMNFFGMLDTSDVKLMEDVMNDHMEDGVKKVSPVRIAFSHFPTSSIHMPAGSGSLSSMLDRFNVSAFLCGHLHRVPTSEGYARHTHGLLELETADFKMDRRVRLISAFRGMMSIRERVAHHVFPLIVPLSPKDASTLSTHEPFAYAQNRKQIVALVVAEYGRTIERVVAHTSKARNVPLLRCKDDVWCAELSTEKALEYGLSTLEIEAFDSDSGHDIVSIPIFIVNPELESQREQLVGAWVPPLGLVPRLLFVHVASLGHILGALFYLVNLSILGGLLFLPFIYRPIQMLSRKLHLLLVCVYGQLLVGPWFVGHLSGTEAFGIASPYGIYWSDIGHVSTSDPFVAVCFRCLLGYLPSTILVYLCCRLLPRGGKSYWSVVIAAILFGSWELLRQIGHVVTMGIGTVLMSPALLGPSVLLWIAVPFALLKRPHKRKASKE
jgi:hypothetical protein